MDERPQMIGRPPRRLEARLVVPTGARAGAVVCHPHPLYGGDMDNPVVVAIARALSAVGVATLRFNFGGVGDSEGAHDDGKAEVSDVGEAVAASAAELPAGAPIVVAGYSFGAWMALRYARSVGPGRLAGLVLVAPPFDMIGWDEVGSTTALPPVATIIGSRDQYCDARRLAAEAALGVTVIDGADHFFAAASSRVADLVVAAAQRWRCFG